MTDKTFKSSAYGAMLLLFLLPHFISLFYPFPAEATEILGSVNFALIILLLLGFLSGRKKFKRETLSDIKDKARIEALISQGARIMSILGLGGMAAGLVSAAVYSVSVKMMLASYYTFAMGVLLIFAMFLQCRRYLGTWKPRIVFDRRYWLVSLGSFVLFFSFLSLYYAIEYKKF